MRDILEPLLGGQFYCRYSTPAVYNKLCDAVFAREVDGALGPLGRVLGHLGEEGEPTAFFARYVDLSDPRDRLAATEELRQIRDQIAPVLEFIQLCARAGRGDICLAPGEELYFGELLSQLEHHTVCREQLRDLAAHSFFARVKNADDYKDKLTAVLRIMIEAGYLVRKGAESSIYVATGKMGYLYQVMTWIVENQRLLPATAEDGVDQQKSMPV